LRASEYNLANISKPAFNHDVPFKIEALRREPAVSYETALFDVTTDAKIIRIGWPDLAILRVDPLTRFASTFIQVRSPQRYPRPSLRPGWKSTLLRRLPAICSRPSTSSPPTPMAGLRLARQARALVTPWLR
jgi:hypothetical protein